MNDFMGYVVQVDRQLEGEFTPDQIESILMINTSFELYFEDNIIPPRTNRGANNNAKTEEQKIDQLIEAFSHAFGISSDRNRAFNVQIILSEIQKNLSNFKAYESVHESLMSAHCEEKNPVDLPDDILAIIKELQEEKPLSPQIRTHGVNISLPDPPKPRKP